MKPNYAHATGIAQLNGILQMSGGKSKADNRESIHVDWSLQWSAFDNHLVLGKRISALQTLGIPIPPDMRVFAEKMGIDCDAK